MVPLRIYSLTHHQLTPDVAVRCHNQQLRLWCKLVECGVQTAVVSCAVVVFVLFTCRHARTTVAYYIVIDLVAICFSLPVLVIFYHRDFITWLAYYVYSDSVKVIPFSLCMFSLGRLPNFGSRPNTMGGKFPSVRPCVRTSVCPQKVSSISMKFGIQVVLDERWKKGNDHAWPKVKVRSGAHESRKFDHVGPFSNSISSPIYNGGWQMTTES